MVEGPAAGRVPPVDESSGGVAGGVVPADPGSDPNPVGDTPGTDPYTTE
jgi:hypothetical protein